MATQSTAKPAVVEPAPLRLCDLALETGPDAPTLCGEWSVRQLVAHLVVRETSPKAAGIVVPPLASVAEKETQRVAEKSFEDNVKQLRKARSPMAAVPAVDKAINTAEFFVHHEDIRRARADWEPRSLTTEEQQALWRVVRLSGKALIRPAGVPVVARRSDAEAKTRLKEGGKPVVVRGLPSELVLFLYGRPTRGLTFEGPQEKVTQLREAKLGI